LNWESGNEPSIKHVTGLLMGASLAFAGGRLIWSSFFANPNFINAASTRDEELRDMRFPGWSGPIVGLVVGAFLGLKTALSHDELELLDKLLVASALGVFGGAIVWGLDTL